MPVDHEAVIKAYPAQAEQMQQILADYTRRRDEARKNKTALPEVTREVNG